ncbi:MAG TPA: long-chain fatty acid--CoA ligase [Acidimicrobiales bacterium]|nr:long-chain fatty acid--CoA ligase [Acidimicrobiales bacterium]
MTPDLSLGRWFSERARRSPLRRAITFEGTTWTYAELQDRIDRLAGALRGHGVCHGDRVGFLGLNQPAFFVTMFAASRLGAIFVPLNFRLTGPELSFIIGDAGIHTLVVDEPHRAVIDTIRGELPVRHYWSADSNAESWPSFAHVETGHAPVTMTGPIEADEVAVIMYTSGTTGRPKGAMLTHGNLWWNNTNALLTLDAVENDVSLVVAPLFHIGGLNVTTLITWMKGGEVVLHRMFDPGRFLEDVARYRITTTFGVPAMLLFVSQQTEFDSTDLTTLRLVVCGGAPVPEPLIKLYNGRGIPINQGYGLTETAPMVTFLTSEFALAKLGSAGTTPPFVDVRLIDADGNVLTEPLARGEVCAKGPNIMKGYWNRPDATAAAIDAEGWFHTGDIGYLDEDGFLYIADRVKDMVITGGENVYPAEVESVLYEHPAVAEVAVIGLPDERWGEAVAAVVALAPDASLDLEDLRAFASERLARYKLPTRLELIDALPRNPAGKVLKFELRTRFG